MINQKTDVKADAEPSSGTSEGLMQARRIQTHIKQKIHTRPPHTNAWLFSGPLIASPTPVTITRWIE